MKSNQKKAKTSTAAKSKKAPLKKGQKATVKRAKKTLSLKAKTPAKASTKAKSKTITPVDTEGSLYLNHTEVDLAHAPGHKKMNRKTKAGNSASFNSFAEKKSLKAKKAPVLNRRIITGAAVGKTGRITTVR